MQCSRARSTQYSVMDYCCLVAQLCLTLYNPMDCSLPGSSVHAISQRRMLKWVAISFSRVLPHPGVEPTPSALQVDSLPLSHQGSPVGEKNLKKEKKKFKRPVFPQLSLLTHLHKCWSYLCTV